MTRVGTRPIAAFIAAVLLTALFAACGGSSSDLSSTTTGATTPDTTAHNESQDGSSKSPQGQGSSNPQSNGQGQSQAQNGGGTGNGNVAAPLEVSGGGSAQFRTKGGDNSIQEFGDESDESELQEAAEVVHDFYAARAKEEWGKACSYLAKSNIEQLEQLGSQSPRFKDAGCAPILRAFTRPVPASVNREITTIDAGSLRHEGEQGFLIYYGGGHVTYAMPLRDEGGTWKVAALAGSTLG